MLQDYEIDKIKLRCKELGVNYNEIASNLFFSSSYEKIIDILGMSEWEDEKFQSLLTSNIWQSNYVNVKKILDMPEWEDKKFQSLLTSNIWHSKYADIKNILVMPEWNDKKIRSLLTSNIWKGNYKNIRDILHMEEWNNPKYTHLLTSSTLTLNPNKIRQSIALAKKLNIDGYIGINFIRKSLKQVYAIAMYLNNLNVPLIGDKGKLNSHFIYETTILKKKYNIDLKELVKMYPMPEDFLKEEYVR